MLMPYYRAWLKSEDRMIPVFNLDLQGKQIWEGISDHKSAQSYRNYNIDSVFLMMWSFYKDKNQAHVFEKDIITNGSRSFIVDWIAPRFVAHNLSTRDTIELSTLEHLIKKEFWVQGDSFRNPELLKNWRA